MKRTIHKAAITAIALLSGIVMTARADWPFSAQPNSYPYNFGPSAIVPKWSEVNAGEWTFNYEGALARAKAEGKYTLLLFTGSWWCPHCQALERDVLTKNGFKNYVAEQGYYLAALDFPYRDGHSMWTWLWDPAYREANGIGDWTPKQIADEYIKRFEFQDLMHAENGATKGKFELAKLAKKYNLDAIHDTVHEMARDEARHGKAFKGLLDRYFK